MAEGGKGGNPTASGGATPTGGAGGTSTGGAPVGGQGGQTSGGGGGTAPGGGGATSTGGAAGVGGMMSSGGKGGGGRGGNAGGAGAVGGSAGAAASGGSAGSGGAGGRGGAAGSGSGGAGGQPACSWGGPACPSGEYCNAPGCGAGTCTAIPAETSSKNPVCGCDDVTYWNSAVAAHASMSTKSSGACAAPAKMCGGIAGLACPTGALCNYQLNGSALCAVSDRAGTCWFLPAACPSGPGFGPNTRACSENSCTADCALIKAGKAYYMDNTCPQ